jgi:MFS transporter, AAHS family, cis,cis-muconate transporter
MEECVDTYSLSRRGPLAGERAWIAVFVFAFLGLMVDGADLMFLSYSLSSLKQEFGLSQVQAGTLGSITLAGMAVANRGLEHRGVFNRHRCTRIHT